MTDKIVKCPSCESENARIKARRKNTISYQCKDCKSHFSLPLDYYREKDNLTAETVWNSEGENSATVTLNTPNLDEAIKKFGVNTEDWDISKYRVEERESACPSSEGGGKRSLYKITMDVQRKNPIESHPPIQPVTMKHSKRKQGPKANATGMKTAMVLSDGHIGYARDRISGKLNPFHDRTVWPIAFEIAAELEPDVIVINGDLLDAAELTTKFSREPEVYFTFQPSLIEAKWILSQFRDICPYADIVFNEGNHEQRLPNFLVDQFTAAYDLRAVGKNHPALSCPELLGLDDLDITWIGDYPDGKYWLNENLEIKHGNLAKNRAGATAEAYLESARSSVITGHIHRAERASKTLHHYDGPKEYFAECFGMMGSPNRTPGHTKYTNWQQGFGVVYYMPGDGGFSTVPVNIYRSNYAIFNGKEYTGSDYSEELKDCTEWSAF